MQINPTIKPYEFYLKYAHQPIENLYCFPVFGLFQFILRTY